MTVLVVAEKPSVARDIAQVLGARSRAEGHFRGEGWIVTWAIGHLVALAEPHEMNPSWKKWRHADLPLLPPEWPLMVADGTRDQFDVVRRLLRAKEIRGIVCATDAGREGELIFRYIYEAAGATKPVRRLWISSLTPEAIAAGFRNLKDGREFDRLADAARARSRADWLVGMNLSRLYSLRHDDNLSVGRVQTPTLAMLVERELEIRSFVPEDYLEVVATFGPERGAAGKNGTSEKDGATDGASARASKAATGAKRRSTATTAASASTDEETYEGTYVRPGVTEREASKRLPADGEEAKAIVARAKTGAAHIESVDRQSRRLPPPNLYDLTELQRHANRLFGYTAQRTLEIAQGLYEKRKLISYPRTDSRYLSKAIASTLPEITAAIAEPYRDLLAPGTGTKPLGSRFVDDARVSDHHAIIPTETRPPADLRPDERAIYDLVCRRLLSAWHGDHVYAVTNVVTVIVSKEASDRFVSTGTSVEVEGWKVLDVRPGGGAGSTARKSASSARKDGGKDGNDSRDAKEGSPSTAPTLPGGLAPKMRRSVVDAKAVPKRTKPPPRLTDGTLLSAMETAGRTLSGDMKELSRAMRDCGLGTPATRAAILETLLRRAYVVRDGKMLQATDKGVALIEMVHAHVKSPAMTGEWEAKFARIERGEVELDAFMKEIERYVRDVVGTIDDSPTPTTTSWERTPRGNGGGDYAGTNGASGSSAQASSSAARVPRVAAAAGASRSSNGAGMAFDGASNGASTSRAAPTLPASLVRSAAPALPASLVRAVPRAPRPERSSDLLTLLRSSFGLSDFRPYQEDVCRAAANGKDVLLVMPTGAGKSLCYQLPGIARGGTTLVISPLIALMEDQVAQLVRRGFAADRIHSGRSRVESRAVCKDYLDGTLDFLFIAAERLGVPGFPEMLGRRKPTLVAIDEAHCISQWGHDFRPDYRMLGGRLELLRPSPVIALTATATPAVQDDIAKELRLSSASRFIHGFRRTNIGIEVLERNPADRGEVVRRLLSEPGRRPAIVYAPTRKEAEQLAKKLSSKIRAAAYHAGLGANVRDEIQAAFLSARLDVIVATTAFGMGIDKADVRTVIHTALPASVEGYYQEIGRAGRDGAMSRAILLHSFVDTKTHEFFLERDYPDTSVLTRIQSLLRDGEGSELRVGDLARRVDVEKDVFETALEKLVIHGGAIVEGDAVRLGPAGRADWAAAYARQRAHKREQLDKMRRYADLPGCRMLQLVAHFGDQHDEGEPCGLCDVCAPEQCVAQVFRAPSAAEEDAAGRIVAALRATPNQSLTVGQILRDVFPDGSVDRRSLEHILGALARASEVRLTAEQFVKDGETIAFQRVHLGVSARQGSASRAPLGIIAAPARASSGSRSGSRSGARGGSSGGGGATKRKWGKRPWAGKSKKRASTASTSGGSRSAYTSPSAEGPESGFKSKRASGTKRKKSAASSSYGAAKKKKRS